MLSKKQLKAFLSARPGTRFLLLYGYSHHYMRGWLFLPLVIISIFLLLIGVVLLFIPGPGLLFIGLGLLPIIAVSKKFAQRLDYYEASVRRWFSKIVQR